MLVITGGTYLLLNCKLVSGIPIASYYHMKPKTTNNRTQYPGIPDGLPSISIVIPFEQQMGTKTGMEVILSAAVGNEEKELMKNYSEAEARPLIIKLRSLVKNIKHNKLNKSIAIFVSSLASKVYYFKYSAMEMNNCKL